MSYRIRFTLPDGRTGLWAHDYTTRETAQAAIDDRLGDTGFAYAVEEVASPEPKPEPTSTTERLVGLLRDRHARGLAEYGTTLDRGDLTPEQWAQHAIEEALDLAGYLMRLKGGFWQEPGSTAAHHVEILRDRVKELEEVQKAMSRDLAFAIQIGDAMREAMRHGTWWRDDEGHLASVSSGSWDSFKTNLAKAPSVPVGASEAPREGGDSDRRRLEALERLVEERGKAVTDAHAANYAMHQDLTFALQIGDAMRNAMRTGEWRAGHDRSMASSAVAGWDRWKASLAKAPSVPVGASEAPREGGDSDRSRLEALRAFLDGNEYASLTWWKGEFYAVAEDVVITAPTLAAIADKLTEKEAKP